MQKPKLLKFSKRELRWDFYPMFFRLIKKGCKKEIKKAFKILADIKGIQKTGAPKIIHLMVPRVFVMWDAYIRKHYGFKKGDANDYLIFLKLMQKQFPNVISSAGRTATKLIDEHNYITITVPALKKNKFMQNYPAVAGIAPQKNLRGGVLEVKVLS